MSLFPMIEPRTAHSGGIMGLYVEVQWDFEKNIPLYQNGSPVFAEGKEAVLVWAWKALKTPRFKHEIYTWNYGCELESLVGQPFTDELKRAEAARYVRECLMINPYITDVTDINVSFADGILDIECGINTVYGGVQLKNG